MNNFSFKHPKTGETLWYSRSVAVVGIFSFIEEKTSSLFLLAVKRGNDGQDEAGKWSLPCGYLDFNETVEEAITREVDEETGIKTDSNKWELARIDSNPSSNRQNVSLLFTYSPSSYNAFRGEYNEINSKDDPRLTRTKFPENEGKEIEKVEWIEIPLILMGHEFDYDYSNIDNREWAFNHDDLIKTFS